MTIHIAFNIDHAYVRFCSVTLVSILRSNPQAKVVAHILARGLTASDKQVLQQLAAQYNGEAHFYEPDESLLEGFRIHASSSHISLVTYYRCMLADYLPASLHRVIYLDSDLLVTGSLAPFWQMPMQGAPVAAVVDAAADDHTRYKVLCYPEADSYFNAGVLLIDLDWWRTNNVGQRCIDYAELEKQVKKVRPKLIVAGASAYPRAIDFEKIAEIAHGYGAFLMVDMAHIAGLVAGGQHQSPVPYADVVTTTTHKTLRGPRGGLILTNNPIIAKRINSAVFPGTQGGPLEHVIAAKAVCFGEALKPEFKEYARKIVENAQALAAALQQRGVKLVSGGTDNHLMLIDLRDEECTGKDLEQRLDSVHITANKNTVPGETRSPFVTSGVRLGTPAVTTRGMGAAEMQVIADCIADCIWHYEEKKDEISDRVLRLTREFPLYQ